MKFERRKEQKVEWKDGAVLILEPIPLAEFILKNFPGKSQEEASGLEIGYKYLQESIKGWEGIEDGDSGNPLPVDEGTKREIASALITDENMQDKLAILLKGPFENLANGSNAQ